MTDEQINEIMALVEQYGSECWNDGALKYECESDDTTQEARAAIESALREQVPEVSECLHINQGSMDAAADEYAADYWADLAQEKYEADLRRRGSAMSVSYYVRDAIFRMLSAAPQPATPRKPLFEDLIAQHQGLREELLLQDAQPVQPACPVCNQTPVFEHDRRTGEWAGRCKHCGVEGRAATTETEARRLWIAWHHKRSDATPALFNTEVVRPEGCERTQS
jgi:hypothetical protein